MVRRILHTWRVWCPVLALVCVGLALAQREEAPAPAEEVVNMTLRQAARTAEAVITGADLAVLEGGSAALRGQIAALDVSEMPAGQPSVWVSREQVLYRLQLAGVDMRLVRVGGAEKVFVVAHPAELAEGGCFAAARKMVQSRLSWDPDDVIIKQVRPVELPKLKLGTDDRVRFDADFSPSTRPIGRICVDVAVSVNGKRQAQVQVYLDVEYRPMVAVASRRIEQGEMIGTANVRAERRSTTPGSQTLGHQDAQTSKRATHVLMAGQFVTAQDVETATQSDLVLVRVRDSVRLVACVGELRIVTTGEALQEGRAGQTVRVRNVDSKREVVGRVVGPCLIEVDY